MSIQRVRVHVWAMAGALSLAATAAFGQTIWYVDDDAPLLGNGSSWPTAYKYLQDALNVATGNDEIHVASGIYKPDSDEAGNVTPGGRSENFELTCGLTLIGGYRGCPGGNCAGGDPNEHDVDKFETILSGDLEGDDSDCCFANGTTGCADPTCAAAVCAENAPCCEVEWTLECVALAKALCDPLCENNGENSYHVVASYGCDETTILDGFTIKGGNDDRTYFGAGGGMYNDGSGPTVAHCTFLGNYAKNYGGGMDNYRSSSPTLSNCLFQGNMTGNAGGGMCNEIGSDPSVTDCTFGGNAAKSGGGIYKESNSLNISGGYFLHNTAAQCGGGIYGEDSTLTMENCTFVGNHASRHGAGMYVLDGTLTFDAGTFRGNSAEDEGGGMYSSASTLGITDCTFVSNSAGAYGGGAYNSSCTPDSKLSYCTFSGNSAGMHGGGTYNSYSDAVFEHCPFAANSAAGHGGGMYNVASSPALDTCTFSGNVAGYGGAIYDAMNSQPTLANCLLNGNSANTSGGAMCNIVGSADVLNCTFAGNAADSGPALGCDQYGNPSNAVLTNCILWDGGDEVCDGTRAMAEITYSCVQDEDPDDDSVYPGDGNLDDDPFFRAESTGAWTADGAYDPETGQTTFTDESAAWGNDVLIGRFLNPNVDQARQSPIVANTANTVTVWGDLAELASEEIVYEIHDYHLSPGSSCIDVGDNDAVTFDTDWDGDPRILDGDLDGTSTVDVGADERAFGGIEFVNPPDGIIDARQPHSADEPSIPEGYQTFVVRAPAHADDPNKWELCDTADSGNAIADVSILDPIAGTHTIILAEPIEAGAVTTITYLDTGTTGVFTALPADADSSGEANPGDVEALIACLNGAACAPWQCDTDRLGRCSGADVGRLIDLLNGAGPYTSWNGATPAADLPCP